MKKILIETLEPLIVDYRPGVSNEHETLDYIPASRLRGAFFEFRESICSATQIEALLEYGGPRWTHAWPCDKAGNHWHVFPKCGATSTTAHGQHETKGPKPSWLQNRSGSYYSCSVKTETNMSVGRHYGRHANREGALYARAAISPGQYFVSYLDFPGELPKETFKANIGTRHSANGLCKVTIFDSDVTFSMLDSQALGGNFPGESNSAAIQLLSDAIIPASGGGYLRGLGKADFEKLAGIAVTIKSAYSASKTVSGWAGKWGLPRESAVAIEAGSVWLITVDDHNDLGRVNTNPVIIETDGDHREAVRKDQGQPADSARECKASEPHRSQRNSVCG